MKKIFYAAAILSAAFLLSCNNKSKTETTVVEEQTVIAPVADEIVTNSVTDKQGNTLEMSFNKTQGTATLVLNGETFTLKQDTTASGLRAHNDNYTYEEWQGHIVVKKNEEIIFDNEK
ncbi:MliC family protein [Parabacteroides sp. OttesenSCG-928-G06]|nr:MliC family protein [Parabacteroides sp. OttesenSCG-928-K15]MDL2281815.1 MliC family protein [Parabacteroides sp. OttesenSCG-928-G06]